jgi:hypothetical protein
MRSAEAGAVPAPAVRHAASHTGPRVQRARPARSLHGPDRRASGHGCPRSVRRGPRLHLRPRRYGVSPGPSGYLASEHVT